MPDIPATRGDRRRRHALRLRVEQLPMAARDAFTAIERYLVLTCPAGDGLLDALDDLVSRLETAQSRGDALSDVVGADPAAFADALAREHVTEPRRAAEQHRLVTAVAEAEREQGLL
ncbi:DUF1048 domain-containing protein [Frondihabitans australicus]|uniref:DNA-binding ferritin-like protein (Dps family) n=1 Tax=Frondihabitans australicus TaxID=386892 RepID=A0A495IIW4_9MICO|nr:DUF1048 domain-containing protein [Frondihabitans australicus]RKR75962.1 DNA-binding ferritin-like protein (Dps family) [Frondihabitans australicus]